MKQSPTRISRRLPGIAVPALAGVAAAFCLAPQALADPSAAQGTAHHAVVADTASRLDPWSAQLLSAIKQTEQTAQTDQVAQQQAGSGQPSWYTVKAGDSLSGIAERSYHNQNAWPVLYWANRSRIHWANIIEAGQMLRIPVEPARIPNPPALLGPAPVPVAETVCITILNCWDAALVLVISPSTSVSLLSASSKTMFLATIDPLESMAISTLTI